MTVRNKIFQPNEVYFLTFTILGWRNIFINGKSVSFIYKWFDYIKNNYGNEINGYVIMPNHIHVLMKISDKSPKLPILVMNAKRFLAYEIIKFLKQSGDQKNLDFFHSCARIKDKAKHKVFEDGYDSQIIQSRKFFLQKLNYIHNNPCQEKWQLAPSPEEYKHSSAANYILNKGFYNVSLIDF